ncbi:hypothetical protein [Methylomarinum vadi]|nr:hypothetical protein [Methylomarinum vadi]
MAESTGANRINASTERSDCVFTSVITIYTSSGVKNEKSSLYFSMADR